MINANIATIIETSDKTFLFFLLIITDMTLRIRATKAQAAEPLLINGIQEVKSAIPPTTTAIIATTLCSLFFFSIFYFQRSKFLQLLLKLFQTSKV